MTTRVTWNWLLTISQCTQRHRCYCYCCFTTGLDWCNNIFVYFTACLTVTMWIQVLTRLLTSLYLTWNLSIGGGRSNETTTRVTWDWLLTVSQLSTCQQIADKDERFWFTSVEDFTHVSHDLSNRLHPKYGSHIHTCLMALCLGLPRWASNRKVKPIRILPKQEKVSGSGISWAVCKSASCSRQPPQHPITSVFYRPDALPATQPTGLKAHNQQKTNTTETAQCCKQRVYACSLKEQSSSILRSVLNLAIGATSSWH